ncbi:MAG TPA: hypothetical protein PLB00_15120 [Pseudomonadota bacterium]|jgi:hypothetical protein|nr:hypothetical protein [Pseudomonadota bacterium]
MTDEEIDAWADAYIEGQLSPDLIKVDSHPLWWATRKASFVLGEVDEESFWRFILRVLAKSPPDQVICVLAAGPLEELVAYDGAKFIDRIELEAKRNPAFRNLLGGVWRHDTHEDIWRRVEAARDALW